MTGEGEGKEGTTVFYRVRSNFRAITRLETLATQAKKKVDCSKALKSAVTAYFFDLSCNIIIDEYYKLTKHLSSQCKGPLALGKQSLRVNG